MTFADRERAKRLSWMVIKWIILAPLALVLGVILFCLALLWHAGNIRAEEVPQVVIICSLSKDAGSGSRTLLYRARSHAHCYKSASGAYASPQTYVLPGDGGRLLALCGKELADCPELP